MISELKNADANTYVLLQLTNRHFALPSAIVSELAPPVRLHTFPHTSPLVSGVIVRRGRIVPVYDVARVLLGRSSSIHRFYLIVRRTFPGDPESSAIPVSGECELFNGELQEASENTHAHISGRVPFGDESIEVLNFDALLANDPTMDNAPRHAETQP
ncbi:MAG TPA: chemotaxis protein CheW [Candidatus Acidoferrales bacterium]|nr:chemotaxis protein CheW [Candidatus Acidoferrales bacterium]